jgi:hypothetical protein
VRQHDRRHDRAGLIAGVTWTDLAGDRIEGVAQLDRIVAVDPIGGCGSGS